MFNNSLELSEKEDKLFKLISKIAEFFGNISILDSFLVEFNDSPNNFVFELCIDELCFVDFL